MLVQRAWLERQNLACVDADLLPGQRISSSMVALILHGDEGAEPGFLSSHCWIVRRNDGPNIQVTLNQNNLHNTPLQRSGVQYVIVHVWSGVRRATRPAGPIPG